MKTLSDLIKRIIGSKKLTMAEIVSNVPYAYRSDYSRKVTEMADNGELVRSWDESGMAYYTKVSLP